MVKNVKMIEEKTLSKIIYSNYLSSEYLGDYAGYLFTKDSNYLNSYVKRMSSKSLKYNIGDPLSCAISDSFDNNLEFTLENILNIYSDSTVIEGIVLRQIKESDYFDFLGGIKPVSKFDGEDYFLMKDESDSSYEYKISKR